MDYTIHCRIDILTLSMAAAGVEATHGASVYREEL